MNNPTIESLKKLKKNNVRGYLIIAAIVLVLTLAVMILKPTHEPLPEILLLMTGLIVGASFFRFGVRYVWLAHLVLLGFLVITFISGNYFIGWFGGFIAGTHFGVAWRELALKNKVKYPWTVNGKGLNTMSEARSVASASLRALDGDEKWLLRIKHGSARFDVAGSAQYGLLCHRTFDDLKKGSWRTLENPSSTSEFVEVRMGGASGEFPSRFINDFKTAEKHLEEFLKDPDSKSLGSEWVTDELGEELHIGS